MKAVSLCYHDAVLNQAFDASGFPGASAASYKLDVEQLREHLDALAKKHPEGARRVDACIGETQGCPLLLTFDDGGTSAITHIAGLLEERGWKGHFLVTAGRIATPGFLSAAGIAELHARGHAIGSHSWSHPERMSRCDDAVLRDEWQRSVARLSDIIGTRIEIASVPGGFHSRRVAMAAAEAGIRLLFTSEPHKSVERVGECFVLGRYHIHRRTSAGMAAALASVRWNALQEWQHLFWNGKKLLKAVGGNAWHVAREAWWRQTIKRER